MIRALTVLCLLISLAQSELLNLGVLGKTYPIGEVDMYVQIERGMKNLNRHDLMLQMKSSAEDEMTKDADLPACRMDAKEQMPYEVVSVGAYGMGGKVLVKPGEKIQLEAKHPATLCAIDASTSQRLEYSMNRIHPERCDKILVSGMNILDFKTRYPTSAPAYPYSKQISNALQIRCLPTVVHASGSQLERTEFSITESL